MKLLLLAGVKFPLIILCSAFVSCAYFNTVYNAKNYYRQGVKTVKHDTLMVDSENFDKTIEKSTAIIVKYPDTRWVDDALYMMGASYYFKGDYVRSLEKLDFFIENYPGSAFYHEVQYLRGLAYFKLRRYGSAIAALREAAGSKKYRKKSLLAMLYVYYGDANYSSLYAIADTLTEQSLRYAERRNVLRFTAMAQFEEKRYQEALDTFIRLLAITRDEGERRNLKLRIAETYLELGEYELCRNFLVGETAPEFRDLLGDLYLKIGNIEGAKEICYELAQNGFPDIAAEAYYELAQISEVEDSIDLAVGYYDSALVKSPNSEYGLKARKKSEVLKRIQTLTTETEDTVRAEFLLAEIYFTALDDLPRALQGYEKVYRNHPESKWAPKALYAHLWIADKIYKDDTLAPKLARTLIGGYPGTEYAMSAEQILEAYDTKLRTDSLDQGR
ncbi:MAG: tetratricopeptide repeat protein [candidate division WOR-3 bacterium]|nr:MAG: tetratricopeptide repeat protein [candidate division WOR-3 bacterium]